ncbi:MAG: hypothetical protein GY834_08285, partial [Bacteroidetes bacterium]|nr:hypothetical protein [Bacteroidota bacterium]
ATCSGTGSDYQVARIIGRYTSTSGSEYATTTSTADSANMESSTTDEYTVSACIVYMENVYSEVAEQVHKILKTTSFNIFKIKRHVKELLKQLVPINSIEKRTRKNNRMMLYKRKYTISANILEYLILLFITLFAGTITINHERNFAYGITLT